MPPEMYDREWCRRRHVPDVHMVHMIRARELGRRKPGTHFFHGAREFYQCIHPGRSIAEVEKKNFIIRRFSPDGRSLVCLSANCHDVLVFDYKTFTNCYNRQPATMFEDVFAERFTVNLITNEDEGAVLNKEFILFTNDSRFLIVALEYVAADSSLRWNDIYRNNESLSYSLTPSLINYVICSIDLNTGNICDKYYLDADRLWISHGVTLMGYLLAILSFQHQTIHFLDISRRTGQFSVLSQVGRLIFPDDANLLMAKRKSWESPNTEVVLCGIKQRILTYLYHQRVDANQVDAFLHHFGQYRSLRMCQIQLVTPSIILIRFVNEEAFASFPTIGTYPALFVLMDWQSGDVLGAYDRYSVDFLKLVEHCQEEFKYPHVSWNRFPCTIQHCYEARSIHERIKSAFTESRGGSSRETRKRIICQLPYSFTLVPIETPYLDPSMFRFDDRLTTLIGRAKLNGSDVIRFFSRITCLPLFELRLNQGRLIQLLFHPTDPFAISFDRTRGIGTATFHVPLFSRPDDPS